MTVVIEKSAVPLPGLPLHAPVELPDGSSIRDLLRLGSVVTGIAKMAPYVASKHALLGMGRSVGLELRARGVRVTTYCPGPISTEILGQASLNPNALQPADLGKTVVHIAELPDGVEVQELLERPTRI